MKQSETKKRIEVVDRANDKMKILTRRYAKAYGEEATLQVSGVYRKIGKEAFLKNSKIQRLDLPKSVLELDIDAFRGCSNLTEVNLPEHLAVIGKGCFAECPRLMKAEIPVYVQWIEEETFYKDRRLQTVNFAKRSHVQKIGMDAFRECGNMESIHLPEGVSRIENRAFYRCKKLAHIRFSEGLKQIGKEAFYFCAFEKLELPSQLELIGERAFCKCTQLKELTIPESVRYIEDGAFRGGGRLKTLEILHDPRHIGEWIANHSTVIRCHRGSKVDEYCQKNEYLTEYVE